ncbi:MAG: hypothetical protein J3R72DRAFT_527745 [Linnemannia gamsii]|nr:MAG: hypothetical protein J3R72DRAFT_527745 [Linnemannia gamsii]
MANTTSKTKTASTPTRNGPGAPNKTKSSSNSRHQQQQQELCTSQPTHDTQPQLDDARSPNPPSTVDNSSGSTIIEVDTGTDTAAVASPRPVSTARKRILARRASPPKTRSMSKANSMTQATTTPRTSAESTSLTQKPSITSASPTSLVTSSSTSVTMTPATSQGSQTLITSRPPTYAGSTITRTASIAGNQNIRRVRQAVKLLEEKMQAESKISSPALVVRAKRPRAQDNDSNVTHQVFKHSRIQVHEEAPKRHMRPIVSQMGESRTISFQVPAGMDLTFPFGFSGHFDVPSRGRGSSISAVGQNHGQNTTTATIAICAETLLRHLNRPTRQESSMRKEGIPTSHNNTTQPTLPAITLSLPTNSLRPSCNKSKDKDEAEKVQLNLMYQIEQQQPPQHDERKDQGQGPGQHNPHAILNSVDVEEVLSSEARSSSTHVSSPSSSSSSTMVSQLISRARRTRSHPN